MRLILLDLEGPERIHFSPAALSRPLWQLRCGMSTLGEKWLAQTGASEAAGFVPPYMAAFVREQSGWKINDLSWLDGDDVLLVDARLKAASFGVPCTGGPEVGLSPEGEVLYLRLPRGSGGNLPRSSIEEFLSAAKASLPNATCRLPRWNYLWELVLANSQQICDDFAAAGRCGIEGAIEEPNAIRGSRKDVYIAPGASVHPMVVLDTQHGPIYIDADAQVQPFSRIDGPCYVGRGTMLLGTKCREGNSFGPVCRVGGEVESSIIQGYSNKYHEGFLGHAYMGEWVNLGALTTNSDLKNDYSEVSFCLDGRTRIATGSTKVGSLIGDHAKTSVGALFNTGACVGAMSIILTHGTLLPKYLPSFTWFIGGAITAGRGKEDSYKTARIVKARRGLEWTAAEQSMWDHIFELTARDRDEAIAKGRRG